MCFVFCHMHNKSLHRIITQGIITKEMSLVYNNIAYTHMIEKQDNKYEGDPNK